MLAAKLSHHWVQQFSIINPLTFPASLVAYHSADIVTLNGSNVSAWPDRSGSGNQVSQGTPVNRPALVTGAINGRPAIQFTAANSTLLAKTSTDILGGLAYSWIAVAKFGASKSQIGANASAGGGMAFGNFGGFQAIEHTALFDATDGALNTNWQIWAIVRANGAAPSLAINGTSQSLSGATTTMNAAGGTGSYSFGQGSDLFIAESATWVRALAISEVVALTKSLGIKYGIGVSL